MPKVLISDNLSAQAVDIFRARGGEVDLKPGLSPADLRAIIGGYDGLAIRSATKVTRELLDVAPSWDGDPGRSALLGLAIVADASQGDVVWLDTATVNDASVRAALAAVPMRAHNAEAALIGHTVTAKAIDAASREAASECDPKADLRGPVDYKRDLVRVLTGRAITEAVARAQGEAH